MHQHTAQTQIDCAVSALAAWLETMRGADGYGGPVAHWWQQSMVYTGAAHDWRYEGIIAGYVLLWQRTGDERWLNHARRAADDLVRGQLPGGHFPASAFEINPATAGTPHEAACDVGLLLLALALRQAGRAGWHAYAAAAERNLRLLYVEQLWNKEMHAFSDSPRVACFVPNKAATASEAMLLLAEISGDAAWAERYALPNLDRILAHQICDSGRLDGAIAQNSFGAQIVAKYFPIYIARCVPVLLRGYRWSNNERYADAAIGAMRFIARWTEDGACPTVVYANQRTSQHPCWIAALGDVLRAADALQPYGFGADLSAMQRRLLDGQDETGGIQTATGFAAQAGGRVPKLPDVRDVLHVAGWCDKAFRYLAARASAELPQATSGAFEAECVFQGAALRLVETAEQLEIRDERSVCYRWRKGETWPDIATPLFWLR